MQRRSFIAAFLGLPAVAETALQSSQVAAASTSDAPVPSEPDLIWKRCSKIQKRMWRENDARLAEHLPAQYRKKSWSPVFAESMWRQDERKHHAVLSELEDIMHSDGFDRALRLADFIKKNGIDERP
ncbi:MAG: hypothetical protein AAF509_08840 [Pseudomonadota bacterium]